MTCTDKKCLGRSPLKLSIRCVMLTRGAYHVQPGLYPLSLTHKSYMAYFDSEITTQSFLVFVGDKPHLKSVSLKYNYYLVNYHTDKKFLPTGINIQQIRPLSRGCECCAMFSYLVDPESIGIPSLHGADRASIGKNQKKLIFMIFFGIKKWIGNLSYLARVYTKNFENHRKTFRISRKPRFSIKFDPILRLESKPWGQTHPVIEQKLLSSSVQFLVLTPVPPLY